MIKYKKLLLKLSGEFLFEFNGQVEVSLPLLNVIKQIKALVQRGVHMAVVMGGGNLCRGRSMQRNGVSRLAADDVGMLSTVINGIVFKDYLRQQGVSSRVMSAFPVGSKADLFSRHQAQEALEQGYVVICTGGTGNPLCSTDTAASLRAIELGCDLVLKLSNVDGIYDKDPNGHQDAKLIPQMSYAEYLAKGLTIMDTEACRQCALFGIPIRVADCRDAHAIERIVSGEQVGSIVDKGD